MVSLIPTFAEQVRIHQQERERPRARRHQPATRHWEIHGYLQELEDYPRGYCERRNAGCSSNPAREAYEHGSYVSLLASHGLAVCSPLPNRPGQTTRTLPEAFTGTQREEYNEEPFPGVPWLGEDIHRALCYIQVAKGKNTKSKNAAGTGERSGYGGSVYSRPPTTRTHSRSASICHRITHVDFHLGILPITRLSRRRHSRELHTPYHVT